jgi:hypothetical protein
MPLSSKQIKVQSHSGSWEVLRSPSSSFEIGPSDAAWL